MDLKYAYDKLDKFYSIIHQIELNEAETYYGGKMFDYVQMKDGKIEASGRLNKLKEWATRDKGYIAMVIPVTFTKFGSEGHWSYQELKCDSKNITN